MMYAGSHAGKLASIANLIGEWGDGQTATPRFYFQFRVSSFGLHSEAREDNQYQVLCANQLSAEL
jgi:hypothetical protein